MVVFPFNKYTIYYQRWGDAPVHSIAVALFAPRDKIHFFDDIGYQHDPFTHCTQDKNKLRKGKCSCEPSKSFGKVVSFLRCAFVDEADIIIMIMIVENVDGNGYFCKTRWDAFIG